MATNVIQPGFAASFTVNASDALATFSTGRYSITRILGFPNMPPQESVLFNNSGANLTSAFTNATVVIIQAGNAPVQWETGTTPAIYDRPAFQGTPGTLNATGTLTAALTLTGIVTSTTAATVTATLDTGTAMDVAVDMDVDDAFDWTAIATGANAFNVTASAGHTLQGSGAVATLTSGRFRTRKTAANTFVTYRLS